MLNKFEYITLKNHLSKILIQFFFQIKGAVISNSTGRIHLPQPIELLHLDNAFENYGDGSAYSADFIPHTEHPPKQKDKTKSKSKPKLEQENSEKVATLENPYSAYQYEFPYQYPYNFFNAAPSTSPSSSTGTKNKTKKKSSGNSQNTKKSKDPDKTVVPFISISVAPHQPKGDIDNQSTQNDMSTPDAEANNKSVYSPDKKPPPDQAAYFNYLNTYTPSHHNQDPNKLNSFNGRYPIPNGFNTPFNAPNAYGYGYGYSPYNGYSQMLGRMPFFNIAPIDTVSNVERSAPSVKTHESTRSMSQKAQSSTGHSSSKKNIRNS